MAPLAAAAAGPDMIGAAADPERCESDCSCGFHSAVDGVQGAGRPAGG